MENLDTNDLIEQYLNGSLPLAEQQAVESRLATDAAFRADVELHRQLHEEFADPQKLQLRDLLSDIRRETPRLPGKYNWLKGLGIAVAILFAGWSGWNWFSNKQRRASEPAVPEEIKSKPSSEEPIAIPESRNAPSEPLKKTPDRPIAKADPAAFVPNRAFEDRLGIQIRAMGGSAELQSPAPGANFIPENDFIKIDFRGTAPADADTARFPLAINIYANRTAAGQALFRLRPNISNRSTAREKWTFSLSQRLRLRPGLYYFTIERQADEDLIYVGKFTVGEQ